LISQMLNHIQPMLAGPRLQNFVRTDERNTKLSLLFTDVDCKCLSPLGDLSDISKPASKHLACWDHLSAPTSNNLWDLHSGLQILLADTASGQKCEASIWDTDGLQSTTVGFCREKF